MGVYLFAFVVQDFSLGPTELELCYAESPISWDISCFPSGRLPAVIYV